MPSSRRASSAKSLPLVSTLPALAAGSFIIGTLPQRSRVKAIRVSCQSAQPATGFIFASFSATGVATALNATASLTGGGATDTITITGTEVQRIVAAGGVIGLTTTGATLTANVVNVSVELEVLDF